MKNLKRICLHQDLSSQVLLLILILLLNIPSIIKAQVLETETARPLQKSELQVGNAFEYQISEEGKEYAVPLAFELGLTKRFSLLLEPVAFTQIAPKILSETNPGAIGIGDFEASLAYQINFEKKIIPAFAILGEVKFPTASNVFIGTGKTDYAIYIIASKRIKSFDLHGNIIYNINGSPDSTQLNNTWGLNLGTEFFIGNKFQLFAEVLSVTSAVGENGSEGNQNNGGTVINPEAAGGELSGTIGLAYRIKPGVLLSFGTSYDNNGAFLFRPGLTMNFK